MKDAYSLLMNDVLESESFTNLIEEKQWEQLKQLMLKRELKIEVTKKNYKSFEFHLRE